MFTPAFPCTVHGPKRTNEYGGKRKQGPCQTKLHKRDTEHTIPVFFISFATEAYSTQGVVESCGIKEPFNARTRPRVVTLHRKENTRCFDGLPLRSSERRVVCY